MEFTVITTYRDGTTSAQTLPNARAAGAFIGEEILWEDTVVCKCPELGIEVDGSFNKTLK